MTGLEASISVAAATTFYIAGCVLMFLFNRQVDAFHGEQLSRWLEILLVAAWPTSAAIGLGMYLFDPEARSERRERAKLKAEDKYESSDTMEDSYDDDEDDWYENDELLPEPEPKGLRKFTMWGDG